MAFIPSDDRTMKYLPHESSPLTTGNLDLDADTDILLSLPQHESVKDSVLPDTSNSHADGHSLS